MSTRCCKCLGRSYGAVSQVTEGDFSSGALIEAMTLEAWPAKQLGSYAKSTRAVTSSLQIQTRYFLHYGLSSSLVISLVHPVQQGRRGESSYHGLHDEMSLITTEKLKITNSGSDLLNTCPNCISDIQIGNWLWWCMRATRRSLHQVLLGNRRARKWPFPAPFSFEWRFNWRQYRY